MQENFRNSSTEQILSSSLCEKSNQGKFIFKGVSKYRTVLSLLTLFLISEGDLQDLQLSQNWPGVKRA